MTEIALKARTSVATKKVTSTAPKKTRKKFKTTTWRFANGVKVVRESVRNFRTYQGSTKGVVIAFSKDAAANVFAGELDHRTDTKLFGKASRPVYSWIIDHRSRIEDPVFQGNRLPVRIHLVGNVTLVRPTFISTHDSVCLITVEAASNRLKLVEAEFKGDSSLVSMTHRTQTGIRLHDARLRLSRDVDVDYSLFDDVLFHVPEEGQMNHAIVRDGMKPMFFVGVGDEGGYDDYLGQQSRGNPCVPRLLLGHPGAVPCCCEGEAQYQLLVLQLSEADGGRQGILPHPGQEHRGCTQGRAEGF